LTISEVSSGTKTAIDMKQEMLTVM